MMSLWAMKDLAKDQAAKAAKENQEPFVFNDVEEMLMSKTFPFPNIGSYRPKGWRLLERMFCDKSGLGASHEPALTVGQMQAKMFKILERARNVIGFAVIQEGQFQCYVGVFRKVKS